MITLRAKYSALDIDSSDSRAKLFRWRLKDDEPMPEVGEFFLLTQETLVEGVRVESQQLLQRVGEDAAELLPRRWISAVKPDSRNIFEATAFLADRLAFQ